MNSWSIKLLQNTVKNITKKLLLPAFVFLSLPASLVEAQITPDGTLKTQVEIIQQLMEINGGLREGNNLFHSFSEFNIPEGMEASFQNALDIENIFTRVTGDSISNINGILSTQGAANFFLMNPNGIVFGENASINVGGSFMATTADSINFEDGTSFATTDTNADPILTTDRPSGFTFDGVPGAIEVYGGGSKISSTSSFSPIDTGNANETGLSVPTGETLALIGNNVTIEGGIVSTEGNIELGSIGEGEVNIQTGDSGISLNYDNVSNYRDISLNSHALLESSGSGSSSISLTGNNINLNNGSLLLIQNQGNSPSRALSINASESLKLSGTSPSLIRTESTNKGQGANIDISANQLQFQNNSQILGVTFGEASAGNITVNSLHSTQLSDGSGINAVTNTEGNTGSIKLSTGQLKIDNDARITSSTFGSGDGGKVNIDANVIDLIGSSSASINRTNISASSFGAGNAGNLTIDTNQLHVKDGASVSSSAAAQGNAGSVSINASESINVSGSNPNFLGSSTPESTIRSSVQAASSEGQAAFGLPAVPTGDSGNVTLNTPDLNVFQEGVVSVRNEGTGKAGTLNINANNLNLDDNGDINATSVSGNGGNINLNTDNLQIDNQSTIAATAENQGGGGNVNINASNITAKKDSAISANATGGDGGNVSINSDILLGIDNSDITANAIEGDGGNITINADFIIGFEERARLTPFNDIVASSEFGQSGTININSPESTAEEDLTVNARQIESVEAGEFLKAVCPNRDNRYGKKTFQYYARGVPEGLGNYHDYDEEEILKDLPVHQKIERETYRHSTEPPSLPVSGI